MDRGMTSVTIAEMAKARNNPIHLLEAEFPALTVRLTDAAVQVTWNGQVWLPSAYLGFTGLEESADLIVPRCTVVLSGVDQSAVALVLQDDYFNRPARVRKGFITDALQVLVDPFLVMDGYMDMPVIATDPDEGTCTVSVDIVSRLAGFERGVGRHTNDIEQQRFFPGDRGFEHVTAGEDRVLVWGRVREEVGSAVADKYSGLIVPLGG